MPTVSSPSTSPARPAPQVLDSRTLGRPVHLLPRFAERLRQSLDERLRQQLNRRYRAGYEVASVEFKLLDSELPDGRWCLAGEAPWRVACLIERSLVLSVMAHRYGRASTTAATKDAPQRETATEERALALLCQQLIAPCLQLIDPDSPLPEFASSPLLPRLSRACLIRLSVREPGEDLLSEICLVLECAWLDRLLLQLAAARRSAPASAEPSPPPRQLTRQLTLTVKARLLEQTMSLGDLLALRPGSVVPVRLKSTDVLVDGSRLFTASVAEHQGKLCLTSFSDAE